MSCGTNTGADATKLELRGRERAEGDRCSEMEELS